MSLSLFLFRRCISHTHTPTHQHTPTHTHYRTHTLCLSLTIADQLDQTTQDCKADLSFYSPPIGPQGFPTVGSYVNVDFWNSWI